MTIITRALAVAFPATGPHAEALAAARDAAADREALKSILVSTRKAPSMSVSTIAHLPHSDDADREIRKLMATANAAAESTGKTFRDAMSAITEAQSREIDRLRKIVADISKERPRKIVSVTTCKMKAQMTGQDADAVIAVASDGTVWTADPWLTTWERAADLPQPDAELDR